MLKHILVLACVFSVTFGWGEDGHKMVAKIASDMLTDTAQSIITSMIGSKTLSDIAPIPDDYDHTPAGNWSEPCHFCNLPKDATNFTMEYCIGCCVVRAIENYTEILQNEASNPQPCNFGKGVEPCALIFLVHFVGDVHQPLHVGYGYDLGGNTVDVEFFGQQTNLHHVWDDNIIYKWVDTWEDGASQLEQMASNETDTVKEYESITSPVIWADESFHYVRSTCYNFTDNGESDIFANGNQQMRFRQPLKQARGNRVSINGDVPDLTQKYYDVNLPIIQQRLIAAGVRLGTLLNAILTN